MRYMVVYLGDRRRDDGELVRTVTMSDRLGLRLGWCTYSRPRMLGGGAGL